MSPSFARKNTPTFFQILSYRVLKTYLKLKINVYIVPLGIGVIVAQIFDPRSEALVEPQVVPPLGRHQITEPLMGEL